MRDVKIVNLKTRQERLDILRNCQLYGIVDLGYVAQDKAIEMAVELMDAGVQILQLRAKNIELGIVESIARQLVTLVSTRKVVFILNDYPELAAKTSCDGVHVGQELQDGSLTNLATVRELVGEDMLIGNSTHSLEQAGKAKEGKADYIGFGPLFMTQTKPGRAAIGLDEITLVRTQLGADYPVFCIGGVNSKTLPSVIEAGANRVVVVSDLLLAEHIQEKVESLFKKLS